MVSVRRLTPREWRTYRDLRLRALEESPDAFGRRLSDEEDRADAEWAARLESSPTTDLPLVAVLNGEPVGLAWGKIASGSPDTAHVYQMWVAPEHRSRGAGRALLDAIADWARTIGVRWLELGVVCGDTSAVRLYTRAGFKPVGDPARLRADSDLLAQTLRLELHRSGESSASEDARGAELLSWQARPASRSILPRKPGSGEISLTGRTLSVRDSRGARTFNVGSVELGLASWGSELCLGSVLEIGPPDPVLIGGLDAFALADSANRPDRARVDLVLRRQEFAELVNALLVSQADASATRRTEVQPDGPYRSSFGSRGTDTALSPVRVTRALAAPQPESRRILLFDVAFRSNPLLLAMAFTPLASVLALHPEIWLAPVVLGSLVVGTNWVTRRRRRKGVLVTGEHVELREPRADDVRVRVPRGEVEIVQGHWTGRRAVGPAMELRLGWREKILIGTRAITPIERERDGRHMEPGVYVDRWTWSEIRRALEDLIA